VPLGPDDLGSAAQRPRSVVDDLGEAEIGQSGVPTGIEEIFRFEVTVDDVEGM
jgi:hypothetical protein